MIKSKLLQAHLALFAANLIYGANYTVAKDVLQNHIGPFGFILIRVLGAFFLFSTIWLFSGREKVAQQDIKRLLICAALGVAGNQLMFFKGLSLTSPIHAAIVLTINPIAVLVFSAFILKIKPRITTILGVGLGLAGAWYLIGYKADATGSVSSTEGDIYILLNSLSYAGYLIAAKPLLAKYKTNTLLFYTFGFGLLMVLPFGWHEMMVVKWSEIPVFAWWEIFFVVFGATFLAYQFNAVGLKTIHPTGVSVYIYLQPVLAAIIAISFGVDQLTMVEVVAATLIFSGVYLTQLAKN